MAGVVEASFTPQSGNSLPPGVIADMSRVVRILAGRLHARLPRDCGIEVADLIQAGNVGLLQAARSFEPSRGAPLEGYAKFRIRGEMLEVVRRSAESARMVDTDSAIAEEGTDRDDGFAVNSSGICAGMNENSPQISLFKRERAKIIGEEVKRLPERYRTVVRLRYSGEMTLRQIGAALCVNESRACQIHHSALNLLKRALQNRGVRELSHL
jgi:RNA polymerase sigma factor for flagellar operon FliA